MSTIKIDNLAERKELDRAESQAVSGGLFPNLSSLLAENVLASLNSKVVTQNETNITFFSGAGGINNVGSISTFNVNTGSINVLEGV